MIKKNRVHTLSMKTKILRSILKGVNLCPFGWASRLHTQPVLRRKHHRSWLDVVCFGIFGMFLFLKCVWYVRHHSTSSCPTFWKGDHEGLRTWRLLDSPRVAWPVWSRPQESTKHKTRSKHDQVDQSSSNHQRSVWQCDFCDMDRSLLGWHCKPLQTKWNGMLQHVAATILASVAVELLLLLLHHSSPDVIWSPLLHLSAQIKRRHAIACQYHKLKKDTYAWTLSWKRRSTRKEQ